MVSPPLLQQQDTFPPLDILSLSTTDQRVADTYVTDLIKQ